MQGLAWVQQVLLKPSSWLLRDHRGAGLCSLLDITVTGLRACRRSLQLILQGADGLG